MFVVEQCHQLIFMITQFSFIPVDFYGNTSNVPHSTVLH